MKATEPTLLLGTRPPWRRGLLPLASVAGAGVLAVWVEQAHEPRAWLAAFASLGVALVAARCQGRLARALGWGAALVLVSLGPHGQNPALAAWGIVGAMTSAAAAIVAITRIPSTGGIVRSAPPSAAMGVIAVALVWWPALVARLVPSDGPLAWMAEHPNLWSLGASAASLLVLLGQAELTLRRRALELGVPERAHAIRAVLGMSFAIALMITLLGRAQSDAIGRFVVALASAVVGAAALHADPVRVARVTRRAVVLAIAGGGAALLGAWVVAGRGADAWGATIVTAAVALAIGASVSVLEAPLRPGRGAWLDAFARAFAEASRADPEDAIREVLIALRVPGGLSSASPELWTVAPPRVTTVDRAGYLHHRDAELPISLVATAVAEPDGTLRADVLDALEVRRPELRSLSQWMADRGAWLATVIVCDGEVEGVLVLPRVTRDEPPTLEEVRALKEAAQRLGTACRSLAARARMLARAVDANERAERAEEQMERAFRERALDAGRHALAAHRLVRPATVGGYSAGSRMAIETLERRTSMGAPIALVVASGVDPIPYLARAHLAGARGEAPLVLVDATTARERDLAHWNAPLSSPLALADRGLLVLLDGAALPADVQQLVARALAEKRAPWGGPQALDMQLALTAVVTPEELVAQGRLDPSLALRLGDACTAPLVLPRLRDRVDDLRAIVLDRLAREGLRVFGRPVGIEHAAYARLIEHPFPGEDAELAVIVSELVTRCSGDVVRAADVDALRLGVLGPAGARHRPAGRRKSPLSA